MKKIIVFCTSFIKDKSAWDLRYQKWVAHVTQLEWHRYGLSPIFVLIDDASPYVPEEVTVIRSPHEFEEKMLDVPGKPLLVTFANRLGRSATLSYPGWWRSFLHSEKMARSWGVQKMIHLESDAVILSDALFQYLCEFESGWLVLWTEKYKMPETAIQVVCADQFERFEGLRTEFLSGAFEGRLAEKILPFTEVNQKFVGDRYSEVRRNRWIFRSRKFDRFTFFSKPWFVGRVPSHADFATQVTDQQHLPKKPKVKG